MQGDYKGIVREGGLHKQHDGFHTHSNIDDRQKELRTSQVVGTRSLDFLNCLFPEHKSLGETSHKLLWDASTVHTAKLSHLSDGGRRLHV